MLIAGVQTNGAAVTDAAAAKAQQKADDLQRATEAGWQKPIPFEYQAAGGEEGSDDGHDNSKWLSDAVVYEWIDEYGDVGPRDEALEKQLYEDPDIQRQGGEAGMKNLSFEIVIDGPEKIQPFRSVSRTIFDIFLPAHPLPQFEDAGLHPVILENVERCKYSAPTPIQAYCIPAVLTGHDVVGIAQTGITSFSVFIQCSHTQVPARLQLSSCQSSPS